MKNFLRKSTWSWKNWMLWLMTCLCGIQAFGENNPPTGRLNSAKKLATRLAVGDTDPFFKHDLSKVMIGPMTINNYGNAAGGVANELVQVLDTASKHGATVWMPSIHWHLVQKTPGDTEQDYDWRMVDDILLKAQQRNLKLLFRFVLARTSDNNNYAGFITDSDRQKDQNGQYAQWRNQYVTSYDAENVNLKQEAFIRKVLEHIKASGKAGLLIGCSAVDNGFYEGEYNGTNQLPGQAEYSALFDYSDVSRQAFIVRMKAKYQNDLGAANASWNTSFSKWEDVTLPNPNRIGDYEGSWAFKTNYTQDFYLHRATALATWVNRMAGVFKSVSPNLLTFSENGSMHDPASVGPRGSLLHAVLTTNIEARKQNSGPSYPHALSEAISRIGGKWAMDEFFMGADGGSSIPYTVEQMLDHARKAVGAGCSVVVGAGVTPGGSSSADWPAFLQRIATVYEQLRPLQNQAVPTGYVETFSINAKTLLEKEGWWSTGQGTRTSLKDQYNGMTQNGTRRVAVSIINDLGSTGTVNTCPVLASAISNQTATINQPYSFVIPTNTFTNQSVSTISVTGLPVGLSFNGSSISGTPSATGVSTVNVTATKAGCQQITTSFQLSVANISGVTLSFKVNDGTAVNPQPLIQNLTQNASLLRSNLPNLVNYYVIVNGLLPSAYNRIEFSITKPDGTTYGWNDDVTGSDGGPFGMYGRSSGIAPTIGNYQLTARAFLNNTQVAQQSVSFQITNQPPVALSFQVRNGTTASPQAVIQPVTDQSILAQNSLPGLVNYYVVVNGTLPSAYNRIEFSITKPDGTTYGWNDDVTGSDGGPFGMYGRSSGIAPTIGNYQLTARAFLNNTQVAQQSTNFQIAATNNCPFSNGQLLINWYGEIVNAYQHSSGVWFAAYASNGNGFKSRAWLQQTGAVPANQLSCFADTNPFTGARLASSDGEVTNLLRVYPNPTDGQFVAEIVSRQSGGASISLLTVSGQEIARSHHQLESGMNRIPMNVKEMAVKMMLLKVQLPDGTVVSKRVLVK